MMRFAIAIDAEHHAVGFQCGRGLSAPISLFLATLPHFQSLPAVDFCEHGFHVRLAEIILRVPPVERAQRFVDWII